MRLHEATVSAHELDLSEWDRRHPTKRGSTV
jgi:hypothetical protein